MMFAAYGRNTAAGIRRIALARQALQALPPAEEMHEPEPVEIEEPEQPSEPVERIPHRITYKEIERRVCKATGFRRIDIISKRRAHDLVLARQAIAYLAAKYTEHSYPHIGRLMGGRDHTTIMYACRIYPIKRAAARASRSGAERKASA